MFLFVNFRVYISRILKILDRFGFVGIFFSLAVSFSSFIFGFLRDGIFIFL